MKIAVIPARGGSKRIPGKNVRLFCGRPIIEYSIEAALKSGVFDKVIVSTDDTSIATLARSAGAETPFVRPASLADDFTGTNAVVRHAIEFLEQSKISVDFACCIYPTAPFLRTQDLRKSLELLQYSRKAFAFSVTSFDFPVQRAIRLDTDGTVAPMFPESIAARSQDLTPAYHDAGQFYWGTSAAFLGDIDLYSKHSLGVPLPVYRVHDIDTEEDWMQAELMFRALDSLKAE